VAPFGVSRQRNTLKVFFMFSSEGEKTPFPGMIAVKVVFNENAKMLFRLSNSFFCLIERRCKRASRVEG
jgi:hypothetical protein